MEPKGRPTLEILSAHLHRQVEGPILDRSSRFFGRLDRPERLLVKAAHGAELAGLLGEAPSPGPLPLQRYLELYCKAWRLWLEAETAQPGPQVVDLQLEPWTPPVVGGSGARQAQVRDLADQLRAQGRCFALGALHGSVLDPQTPAYGDLDDLVLLSTQALVDPQLLQEALLCLWRSAFSLYAFDLFQHHSHLAFPQPALEAWPESWLPVVLLRQCRVFHGSGSLNLRPVPGRASSLARTLSMGRLFQRGLSLADLSSAHKAKYLTSNVMLAPAVLFAALGEPLDKATSLDRAARVFPPEALEAVLQAGQIRRLWEHQGSGVLPGLLAAARRQQNPFLYSRLAPLVSPPPAPAILRILASARWRRSLGSLGRYLQAEAQHVQSK
jgi:hypothetical protein